MSLSRLIVALDLPDLASVQRTIDQLGNSVDFYKIGLRLFTHYGPEILKVLQQSQKKIFLDLKLHDIPNTVAEACEEIVGHQVDLFTVHASGGYEMLYRAVQSSQEKASALGIPAPLLLAVTVLTSMDNLNEIGVAAPISDQVLRLVELSVKSGVGGVVCSPHEIKMIRENFGKDLKIITPGIRPKSSASDDQKRVMTPQEAFQLGSDAIVVGRPILKSENPQKVIEQILSN